MIKKIIISFLSLIIIFTFTLFNLCVNISYAETITLSQIVTKFNNCSTVQEYKENGTIFTASNTDNELSVTMTTDMDESETKLEYTLDGTILSGEFSGINVLTGGIVTIILADCIGQLHGYSDGELMDTLNSDEVQNYTVENEGFEIKQLSEESIQVKMDINKKIPLIDISEEDTYIQASDLDYLKEFIIGDGSAQQSKGNIIFHKDGYDDEAVIFVGEKGELTENAYKSILSILEVMFEGEEAANYFEENYSNISVGNEEFDGFIIEVNPEKSDMEKVVLGEDDTYQFIRISIDKNMVSSIIETNDNYYDDSDDDDFNEDLNEDYDDSNSDNDDEGEYNNNIDKGSITNQNIIQTTNVLPQTGLNLTIIIALIISIIIAVVISVKLHSYKDIK